MNDVDLYVRELDGALGGPLYSTLDLVRLLSESRTVRLVVETSGSIRSAAVRQLGLSEHEILSAKQYRQHSRRAPILHLQHVFDLAPMRLANFARRAGVQTVLSPRGALDEWSLGHHAVRKLPARFVLKPTYWNRTDLVHCTAELEAQQVSRLLPSRPVHVVPNVVSMAWESTSCEVAPRPRALFLSRLHAKKRPDLAIRGLAPLLRSGAIESLTIAGSGTQAFEHDLQSICQAEGVEAVVRFSGQLGEAACREAYEGHELLVLPTSQENFGRVLFEALSFGLAVFVTSVVDTWPELDALGAIRIEQDARSIESELRSYLSQDVAERRASSQQRRSAANEVLSRDRLLAGYDDMYASVSG